LIFVGDRLVGVLVDGEVVLDLRDARDFRQAAGFGLLRRVGDVTGKRHDALRDADLDVVFAYDIAGVDAEIDAIFERVVGGLLGGDRRAAGDDRRRQRQTEHADNHETADEIFA